jgi:hypothetical protein
MPAIGEWADVLRALGRSLDAENASHIEIVNHDAFLAVFWDQGAPGAEQRAYKEHDLEALRAQARELRSGTAGGNPGGTFAELLRTLGQDLDRDEVDVSRVAEEDGDFIVSGQAKGKYYRQAYSVSELMVLSAQRRDARAAGRMTTGAPIFTRDNQRVGKVKSTRDGFIEVSTPFLQRDFWIPVKMVAAATPGDKVVLAFRKEELDTHRQFSAPPGH